MLRKLLKFFTGRLFISFVFISLQIGILVNIFSFAQNSALWIQFLSALSIFMTLVVITRDLNPAYKIGWMLIFMAIPVYGGLFYLLFGNRKLNTRLRARLEQLNIFYQKGVEGGTYSELLPMKACKPSISLTSPAFLCGGIPRSSISAPERLGSLMFFPR